VVLRLQKNPNPNISYPALQQALFAKNINNPDIKKVRELIIGIRKKKLPEVNEIGSAGSFFKNPVIGNTQFEVLRSNYIDMPYYDHEDGKKIPAGWLIEKCGLKGCKIGDAGVWPQQALVLVNYGEATGEQVVSLCTKIVKAVFETFGIQLEPEVIIM
jgi:UDP-N-acetylmuramate dehydrogenase